MSARADPELQLSVAAEAVNVALARQAVTGLCEALGYSGRMIDEVRLAVTEACTNVVVHAYPPTAGARKLELDAFTGTDGLIVVVRDHGRGMGVLSDGHGLGLGLPLIAALTDTVEVRANAEDTGTEVVMVFSDTAAEDG